MLLFTNMIIVGKSSRKNILQAIYMLHLVKNVVFTCDSCEKTFGHLDNLQRHALICRKKDEKHCHECKKDFRSPYHLKRHLEQVHVEKDTCTCENCKKVYHRKDFYESRIIKCNGNLLPMKSRDLIKKKNHQSNSASDSGQLDEINLGNIAKIPEETQQEVSCSYSKKHIHGHFLEKISTSTGHHCYFLLQRECCLALCTIHQNKERISDIRH